MSPPVDSLPRFRCSRSLTEGVPMFGKSAELREASPSVAQGRPRGGSPCRLCWRAQGGGVAAGPSCASGGPKKWCSHAAKSKSKVSRVVLFISLELRLDRKGASCMGLSLQDLCQGKDRSRSFRQHLSCLRGADLETLRTKLIS